MRNLLVAFILLPVVSASAGQWPVNREYRRPIRRASRNDTVVFSFRRGGHAGDVSVADAKGDALPAEILSVTSTGEIWVAYQGSKAKGGVWVYYGEGSSPPMPRSNWQPKASLVLMTMKLPPGALNSYRGIAATAKRGRVTGMGFVDKILHGRNPYGPDDRYASAYIGYLKIDRPGKYNIFTNSDEASFVLVDGQEVCSWPGRHRARARHGEHGGDVELSKGLHRIEYYHAEIDGVQGTSLGWTPPWDRNKKKGEGRKHHLVPASAFVHTHIARTGPPERKGNKPLAAFSWRQEDQLLHDDYQYTRIRFENECRNLPDGAKVVWDFGDGTKTEKTGDAHIYVGKRDAYRCSVSIIGANRRKLDRFQTPVTIEIPLKNLTIRNTSHVRKYVNAIVHSDLTQASREAMRAYWLLVETVDATKRILPFAEEHYKRFGLRGSGWFVADRLATAVAAEDPERAAKLFGKLAGSARSPLDAARTRMEQIELLIHRLKDTDRALKIAEAVQDAHGRTTLERRIATVKTGDVYRALGELDKAEEAYRLAQKWALKKMDRREVAVLQSGYLETVASLVKQGRLRAAREALVKWECDYPTGKLTGDLSLQTANYFLELGDYHRALSELKILVEINPLSPYLPQIELCMARACAGLGKTDKARELRDKVMREYPKSDAAKEARKVRF